MDLSFDDNSKVDDSFKQEGTTINLGAGATYNQNSANEKTSRPSSAALFKVLGVSILCDFLLGWFLYTQTSSALDRIDEQVEAHKGETVKMME